MASIIAILNHDTHELYIEHLTDNALEPYGGDEQAYIDDNYSLENYSWDYITSIVDYTDTDSSSFKVKDIVEYPY